MNEKKILKLNYTYIINRSVDNLYTVKAEMNPKINPKKYEYISSLMDHTTCIPRSDTIHADEFVLVNNSSKVASILLPEKDYQMTLLVIINGEEEATQGVSVTIEYPNINGTAEEIQLFHIYKILVARNTHARHKESVPIIRADRHTLN